MHKIVIEELRVRTQSLAATLGEIENGVYIWWRKFLSVRIVLRYGEQLRKMLFLGLSAWNRTKLYEGRCHELHKKFCINTELATKILTTPFEARWAGHCTIKFPLS